MAGEGAPAAGAPAAPDGAISVFVLDDHELVRRGLSTLLFDTPGIDVVGEAATAAEAVRLIDALRPQVALLDVHLPDGSGIEVCRQVRSQHPEVRVLILTGYDDQGGPQAAALAGASGFLLKQARGDALVDAIRRVAAGESLLPPQVVARSRAVHPRPSRNSATGAIALESLTGQERRVLDLIVEGLTNRQIGDRLGIGEQTVKNYVTSVLVKLGFGTRTQAAVYIARLRGT